MHCRKFEIFPRNWVENLSRDITSSVLVMLYLKVSECHQRDLYQWRTYRRNCLLREDVVNGENKNDFIGWMATHKLGIMLAGTQNQYVIYGEIYVLVESWVSKFCYDFFKCCPLYKIFFRQEESTSVAIVYNEKVFWFI